MGIFDNVRNKMGFGEKPEWQDGAGYMDSYDEPIDDGYQPMAQDEGILSFNDYNPSSFDHVKVSASQPLEVASYGDDDGSSYFSRRNNGGYASNSYASNIGTTASRRRSSSNISSRTETRSERSGSAVGATWSAPADPSFLDAPAPTFNRDIYDPTGVVPSTRRSGRDPKDYLAIVKPVSYSDVEKIATAFKAEKIVVLALSGTRPELAKRILDFSFGVACALNGSVDKAADRVFVIARGNEALSEADNEYLRKEGVLR